MKTFIAGLLVLAFVFPVAAQGQGFPAAVRVLWDMNPDVDEVIFYSVSFDANYLPTVVNANDCVVATRTCAATIQVSDNNAHTIAVNATNQWGTSEAQTVIFKVNNPHKPTNVRIG